MAGTSSRAKIDPAAGHDIAQQFRVMHVSLPVRIHPRVKRVLRLIPERLETSSDVSLKGLAAIAGLSPSRLMHVFTESVGVALRPYILGLRLQRACAELMTGATITSAAYSAGFADAAHLTRTFRRRLGMNPTDLLLRSTPARLPSKKTPRVSGHIVIRSKPLSA
jgi:AraC-like DNA-binding protein